MGGGSDPNGHMTYEERRMREIIMRHSVIEIRMHQTDEDREAICAAGGDPDPSTAPSLEREMQESGFDPEVIPLVRAMNRLPGIHTQESCCGHGERPFHIWFLVTDYEARGLLLLSRLLSHNYYNYCRTFRVVLDHMDVWPQVCWLLEGPKEPLKRGRRGWPRYAQSTPETYAEATRLAEVINAHVESRTQGYNILYDR
jgi:hypothetical protein